MVTVTVGQYAISDCEVKINTSTTSTASYATIADLEEFALSIDNNTETWYSIADNGWQNALMTGRALTGSFSGKRTLGDTGNDFLDGLRYVDPVSAVADFQINFPDGSSLAFTAVVGLTDVMGAATDVAPLSGDITGKGKPTFTAAS